MFWENDKLVSQSSPPQQNQDRRQCPEFLLHFKVQSFEARRWWLSGHPGGLACSWLLSTSGSLLETACGACTALGHAAARASRSHAPGREHRNAQVTASPGGWDSERGSLLEATGRVAAEETWPVERTGRCTVPEQVTSQQAVNKTARISLFSWNYVSSGVE